MARPSDRGNHQLALTKVKLLLKNTKANPQDNWELLNEYLKEHSRNLAEFFSVSDVRDYMDIVCLKDGEATKLDGERAYYLSKMINKTLTLSELLEVYKAFQDNKNPVEARDESYDSFYDKVIALIQNNPQFHKYLKHKVYLQKTDGAEASVDESKIKGISIEINHEGRVSPEIVIKFIKNSGLYNFFHRDRSRSSGSGSAASASSVDEQHLTVPKEDKSYQLTLDKFANFYLREPADDLETSAGSASASASSSAFASPAASPARPAFNRAATSEDGKDLMSQQ